jgi:hypothetical protein
MSTIRPTLRSIDPDGNTWFFGTYRPQRPAAS